MRFLAILVIIGVLVFVLFSYFDAGRVVNVLNTEAQRVADEKRALEIIRAKEAHWARFYHAPKDCLAPGSALRELECKNHRLQMRERFERQWSQQIASGWVPPELSK
jgi:hypothetical protein